jgi:hypothetical protein
MEPTLLVALSNAVAEMPAVIEALSKDPAVLQLKMHRQQLPFSQLHLTVQQAIPRLSIV